MTRLYNEEIDYRDLITYIDSFDSDEKMYCSRIRRLRFCSIVITLLMMSCLITLSLLICKNLSAIIGEYLFLEVEHFTDLIFVFNTSGVNLLGFCLTFLTAVSIGIKGFSYIERIKYPNWKGTFIWSFMLLIFISALTFLPKFMGFEDIVVSWSFASKNNLLYSLIIICMLLVETFFIIPILVIQSGYPIRKYLNLEIRQGVVAKVVMQYLYLRLGNHRNI